MTIEKVYENLVQHYKDAENVTLPYKAENIFRVRQHSISSIAEDLFAFYLREFLLKEFNNSFPIYLMVDYRIQPKHNDTIVTMFPDIAIVIEKDKPILASYIDLKLDIGYKRDYFQFYPEIVNKIKHVRNSKDIGTFTYPKHDPVLVQPNLKWRTVVLSTKNSNGTHFQEVLNKAQANADYLDIYFLARNQHPNEKIFDSSNIVKEEVSRLLEDIKLDIEASLKLY